MNKTAIKNFAIWARVRLIEQVTQLAYEYDVIDGVELDENQDSLGGDSLPEEVFRQRRELVLRIKTNGFQNTMEEVAYTWFNRFTALRFMEVNGYLPSKVRIFSDDEGRFKPEVLREALTVEIAGLNREHVVEMLDRQENENLYKYLIITQCNELNAAIPALFEKLGGWTELLFPRNLLQEDSVLQHLVEDIPETDWQDQVQIIGWLYQYYNTEPKDKVFADMKKNIKISKESIPAATQLFTPDWIVRYMVQNSLGRLYSGQCVASSGKQEQELAQEFGWKYYLPEAAENPSTAFGGSPPLSGEARFGKPSYSALGSPERGAGTASAVTEGLSSIRFLDPCMGSGHILVYAFDVLMQMYTAAGWAERDAAREIVAKNLYGLDLDKRAYQLAYFSIVMKARQYDRRYLRRCAEDAAARPNLSYFQDMPDVDSLRLSGKLGQFVAQFRHADVFGSLISVQPVAGLDGEIDAFSGEIGLTRADLQHLLELNRILSQQYDIVCTNPPYMGGSGMNPVLSEFVKKKFPDSKSDLFACFIERCGNFAKANGYYAMITQHAWMFLSSYEKFRKKLMQKTFVNMAHLGARAFDEIGGEVVQTVAFVHKNAAFSNYLGTYVRMVDTVGEAEKEAVFCSGKNRYTALQSNFSKIPGSPVAYWVGEGFVRAFERGISVDEISDFTGSQNITANNDKYLRFFWEVKLETIGNGKHWAFYAKGGEFRRWYGNVELVVDITFNAKKYYKNNSTSNLLSERYWFQKGITYSAITSKGTGFRMYPAIGGFDKGGATICYVNHFNYVLALLNSNIAVLIFRIMNPTINLQVKDVKSLPIVLNQEKEEVIDRITDENIGISKDDWDSYETSFEFRRHPLV